MKGRSCAEQILYKPQSDTRTPKTLTLLSKKKELTLRLSFTVVPYFCIIYVLNV